MENKQQTNQEVNPQEFPSEQTLENIGMTKEQFEQKVEEQKELSVDEGLQQLNEMQKQNEQLQQQIEEMNQQLEKNNLITALANNGLSEFAGLFDLQTIDEKVEFLKKVKNEILIANSYVPKDVAKQDEYTTAIEQKDVNKAINFKLSKLFGK